MQNSDRAEFLVVRIPHCHAGWHRERSCNQPHFFHHLWPCFPSREKGSHRFRPRGRCCDGWFSLPPSLSFCRIGLISDRAGSSLSQDLWPHNNTARWTTVWQAIKAPLAAKLFLPSLYECMKGTHRGWVRLLLQLISTCTGSHFLPLFHQLLVTFLP